MSRRLLVGVVVAGAILLLFGRTGRIAAQQGGHATSQFVKVGGTWINMDLVTHADDRSGEISLFFNGPSTVHFKGAEAHAVRRWLNGAAGPPLDVSSARP
jgi:hypothetical protein